MSKLLDKYEEFLEELDSAIEPLQSVVEGETFTQEECHTIANFCTAVSILRNQEEISKECIEGVELALHYFKYKKEK